MAAREIAVKKYVVKLSEEERARLNALVLLIVNDVID